MASNTSGYTNGTSALTTPNRADIVRRARWRFLGTSIKDEDSFPMNMEALLILLMRRDKLSLSDAQSLVRECLSEISYAITSGNYHDLDEIIMDELGLEADFVALFLEYL